ncbi:KxYKxGKxW signal peptide domain-containing protein, partial [Listeria sp. FSL L7-0091]|uniref:leucine-rich repeat domain-containing protein n=1 Tax=Listeria farberi TaxID=2713500 RepID=UPI00162590F8
MRFSRKEREQKQKNWRMWKKGKQWLCGAALFFTVVSSPGMLVLADEVNAGDATEVTAGDETPPLPEGSTENEGEETTVESGTSSPESADPNQQEENTQHPAENNETNAGERKKAKPKTGRTITQPTAISDLFPDANLAEVIRSKLGKASVSDTVTQSDLDSIFALTANNKNIANISGLNHLSHLNVLVMKYNQISDLSELSGIDLRSVELSGNQISDISGLSGLTNIVSLDLSNNQLSDISALSGLTKITTLNLNANQLSDISALSGLTKITTLNLNANQLSNLSGLSGLTEMETLKVEQNQLSNLNELRDMVKLNYLYANNNQISDISGLRNTLCGFLYLNNNQLSSIEYPIARNRVYDHIIENQQVTLSVKWSKQLEIPNGYGGYLPSVHGAYSISDGGEVTNSLIKWTGVPNERSTLSLSWRYGMSTGLITNGSRRYSGTTTVLVEPVAVKIMVDSDGKAQTTGDRTLFAEEPSGLYYLEDMYNYAKDQLNGTDYGLMNIETDSNGDYVILVSKVGALKKEDANGNAVGTDVAYTPTYTVVGTEDDAELVVSYDEVVIDAPPTGYIYIYEKGTTQEVRYTTETVLDISLTDTDGDGIPQWKEDYIVKQYQRAGALNPTLPDGSQVPGGSISIPDDAVEGDRITVPDMITGSDGKEYGVDPSVVDTDPNTPGVQITLTDDEQDIPYFDIALSESESESASLSESESISLSESESSSLSESESSSLSESESSSLSESESISQSTSESISLSESESVSQSESESSSLSESESSSLSESESISQSTSESISLSESESVSQSESESSSLSESESSSLSESESSS